MEIPEIYQSAKRDEELARLRRVIALRAMVATGMSQRQIGEALGISQSAVSQQLKAAPDLSQVHPEFLLEAAAPVLKALAEERGYTRLSVFGSVARKEARPTSDIDLLVASPEGTSLFEFQDLKDLIQDSVDRDIDLVDFGGLKPMIDDDIRKDSVLL